MQYDIIINSFDLKPQRHYRWVIIKKYEVLLPMDNNKALSPVEKYEVLSSINNGKTSSSIDKYETSLPLNEDTVSSSINSEAYVNHGFVVI